MTFLSVFLYLFYKKDLILKSPRIISSWLEVKLIELANKKIEGKITVENLDINFDKNHLGFEADSLKLEGLDSNLVLEAKELKVLLKWSALNFWSENLFLKGFQKILSKEVVLNLVKDENSIWNLEKIFKLKREKKSRISIDEINIPLLKLEVKDQNKTLLDYKDLKVFWSKQSKESAYYIDISSHPLKEILIANNYFKAYGKLNSKNPKEIFNSKSKLYLDFKDLKIESFSFLLDFLPKDYFLIPEIFREGILNAHLQIDPKKQEDKKNILNPRGFIELKEWNGFSKINIESNLLIDKNLEIKNFLVKADDSILNIEGNIDNFYSKNSLLNLKVIFHKLNLLEVLPKSKLFSKLDLSIFINNLKELDNFSGIQGFIDIKDQFSAPALIGELNFFRKFPEKNDSKNLKFNISFDENTAYIRELFLLWDFSKISLKGYGGLDQSFLDLKINTEDLSIYFIHKLISGLPILLSYQNHLNNFSTDGFCNLDLSLKKSKNEKDAKILGTAKLAKVNFSFPDYPINFSNLYSDLILNGNRIEISHLAGYIQNDYIEAQGNLKLNKNQKLPDFELDIASNKLDASNIKNSGILKFFNLDKNFRSFSGFLKDLRLTVLQKNNNFIFNGQSIFENISVSGFDNHIDIKNLNGPIAFSNEKIESTGLDFKFGYAESSLVGYFKNEKDYDLDIVTENIDLPKIYNLIPEKYKQNFKVVKGLANLNLRFFNKKITGSGSIKNSEITNIKNKYLPYTFNNLNLDFDILEDSIDLSSFSGLYNLSDFTGSAKLSNFKEPIFDIQIKSNLFTEDFNNLIPKHVSDFLNFEGYLPLDLEISGNRRKQKISFNAQVDKLEYFKLSDWLSLDKGLEARLKGSIDLSNNSLVSKNTTLVFKKKGDTNKKNKAKLKADYSVTGFKEKNTLYHLLIETADENSLAWLLEPNLVHTQQFNLDLDKGDFRCNTFGSMDSRQTICDLWFNQGTSKQFGIGDLFAKDIKIKLFSYAYKPLDMVFSFKEGNWNTIPYTNLDFDLNITNEFVIIQNLKANVLDGRAWADIKFNLKDESSDFQIIADRLPAHELAQGIWMLGSEIPSGIVNGNFEGHTKGIEAEELFFNLEGNSDLVIKNGKLSQLESMKRILSVISTFKKFDLNNVMYSLVNFEGGLFDYLITALSFDKGKVSTNKVLLKAPQIEITGKGYADYKNDYIEFTGEGLIPKHSKSFLQHIGLGEANLGNLASIASLNDPRNKEKRHFEFYCSAPVNDNEKIALSIKEGFSWKEI